MLLCLLLLGSISCNPLGSSRQSTPQLVKVVRGDVTANVSGSGNIEISKEVKLAFGVGGRIDKMYVKEGDEVSKGQVLARLETDVLELALAEAEMSQTKAQIAVVQTQAAITQAQLAQQTAEYELDKAQNIYKWPALEVAQADVEIARNAVRNAEYRLGTASTADQPQWVKIVAQAELNLFQIGNKLNAMLAGADPDEVAIKRLQLEIAGQSVELARQAVAPAQQAVKLAEQSLKQAQKQLNEATISSPFAGVVADVSADERDMIPSPGLAAKTIVRLVDPGSMELKVRIDEIDIAGVKPGQKAVIEVDALPVLRLEGKVSYVSFLPTGETNVVGYEVKISFDVPNGVGLRSGMSASADIINAEGRNVLLIPERAIKRDNQGKATVEVMVNGQIEVRAVVTGISDGLQTEIVEGLREGETVLEKRAGSKSVNSTGSLFGG